MTFAEMAQIHARAFTMPRPWSEAEIGDFLISPLCFSLTGPGGFLIGRVVAGEAELLTVAVDPAMQGHGVGLDLVQRFLAEVGALRAERAFLEVAETNVSARAVYTKAGFAETGRRRGYYHNAAGHAVDAIVMSRAL